MSLLNAALRRLFDLLLYPFQSLPAAVGIAFVSLLAALGMLWVFKRASNQAGIEAAKNRMYAGIFEIRLFNDSFKQIWRAQGAILSANLTYLRHQLKPMLFILPPLVLAIAQLQFHWAYAPPAAGETTELAATLVEGWQTGGGVPTSASGKPQAELELPAGLAAETPALWIPSQRTLVWRLRVDRPGDQTVGLRIGGRRYEKRLAGSRPLERRSPVRPGRSWVEQFVYPAESPLPADGILDAMTVRLKPAEVALPGFALREMASVPAWMTLFFVLSIVFAFALRKRFGVTF